MRIARIVLGDQLNPLHSWFSSLDPSVTYVMMELRSETDYVPHHLQKIVAFFLAMRDFAEQLKRAGHLIQYIRLDDADNQHSFSKNIGRLIEIYGFEKVEYQEPDEYRLQQEFLLLSTSLKIPLVEISSEHFLTERNELQLFFKGKKKWLMETFYRSMREKHSILMLGQKPLGQQWNFDHENRNKLPKNLHIPEPLEFAHPAEEIIDLIQIQGIKTIGSLKNNASSWPINRTESLELLEYFCTHLLPHFGTYQDAMAKGEVFLFHSRISFSLNSKMLAPLEVIQRVELEYHSNSDSLSLGQVEGYIRQILGWREYIRGVYWAKMPGYMNENFFQHSRALPSWFWTGDTKMNCLKESISQSLDFAYAHHIQRLMITGNFALLAGIHPREIHQWYLGIYIDAIEWVEMPNTLGMSQYADGGFLATKPYVSSANYIHKMSNYCETCVYSPKEKTGAKACPFNALYWNFFIQHRSLLENNPRIGMAYRNIDKMDADLKLAYQKQADAFLSNIENV